MLSFAACMSRLLHSDGDGSGVMMVVILNSYCMTAPLAHLGYHTIIHGTPVVMMMQEKVTSFN